MGKCYNSKWDKIIARAKTIAVSYDTPVTLRQLFYRLVAAQLIPNNQSSYNQLSQLTAEGRRRGTFPELIDNTRNIVEPRFFDSPADAIRSVARWYRSDRLSDQPYSVYLGVEKRGLVAQLDAWFGEPYHIPILPLGGFSSQSFVNVVKDNVARRERKHDRKTVLLYAGDFDASGVAIDRVFGERTAGCFAEVRRIALNPGQVTEFGLARQAGKPGDNNVDEFFSRYGEAAWFEPYYAKNRRGEEQWMPVQVELDALDPNDLRQLFTNAVEEFLDLSEISNAAQSEADDRTHLRVLAEVAGRFSTDQLQQMLDEDEDN